MDRKYVWWNVLNNRDLNVLNVINFCIQTVESDRDSDGYFLQVLKKWILFIYLFISKFIEVWPQWVACKVNKPRDLNKFRKKSSSLLIFTLFFSRTLERTSRYRLHKGQTNYIWIAYERRRHHNSSSVQSNLRKRKMFWRHVHCVHGGKNYIGFYRFP